jgi:hypothetical protein
MYIYINVLFLSFLSHVWDHNVTRQLLLHREREREFKSGLSRMRIYNIKINPNGILILSNDKIHKGWYIL